MGADLVAREYETLINKNPGTGYINSDCPAIVSFVEKYHPGLIGSLTPVVSPMVATARYIRKEYGEAPGLVFIGPCIAKKDESDEVDAASWVPGLHLTARNLSGEKRCSTTFIAGWNRQKMRMLAVLPGWQQNWI